MRAMDATRKPPAVVGTDASIGEAARRMDEAVVGALVVMDGDTPVGIVTDRDIVVRAVAHDLPGTARVDTVMSRDLVTIDGEADLRDAFELLRAHPVRRIPVMHGERLIGLISADDLLVDIAGDLRDLCHPITGQVVFGVPASEAATGL